MEITVEKKMDIDEKIASALAKNDEEWEKRLLLMVMIMAIAMIGIA